MSTVTSKKVDGYRVNTERYSSAQEVVQDCKTRQVRQYEDMSKKELRYDWHGVDSYDKALELLRVGYQHTVEKLQTALKASATGVSKRIKFENNVHGFAPVVPLALKGVPNSMINTTIKQIKCKVVDIYYDMGIAGFNDADTIIKAGQKMLGAIIALEKQGYRINLNAIQCYSDSKGVDILSVKVKSADKPLDIKRVSFPLTHPAFFRVIGFDWQSKSPIAGYRGGGRGFALTDIKNRTEIAKIITETFGKNAIYISCSEVASNNEDYIKEVLTNDKGKN